VRTHSKAQALAVLLLAATGGAQSVLAAEIEEVIVTAQKREQKAQDVGIAITTLTGEELAGLHYTNTSDIVAQAPGVLARRQFPSRGLRSNFFIRGVGSTDFNDATETPVAIYVDDFYLMSPSTADFSLMDIARVEVLKGPQGTLFGRNTNGGAVQFVTNKPQFDGVSGYFEGGLGTSETRQLQGVLNVPISDKFAIRAAAQLDNHGFYTKNVLPGGLDAGDQNYTAARVSLRFRPTDAVDATYKFEHGDTHGAYGETDPLVTLAQAGGDVIRKPDNTNAFGYNPSSNGTDRPDRIAAEGLNQGFNKIQSHLLRVDWHVSDNVDFTSITGFLDQRYLVDEDCDGTPSIICNYAGFYQSKHYSQEFRLNGVTGPVNWTAGLYYLHQSSSGGLAAPLYFTADGNPDPSGVTPGLGFYADFDNRLKAYAAFGQIEYAATDHVTLIGGLRFAKDDRDFEETYPVYNINTPNSLFPFRHPDDFLLFSHEVTSLALEKDFTKATVGDLTNSNKNSISGTLQVNWQPAEHQLFYASVRRGVKAAGFNNGSVPVFDITLDQFPFGQEKLMAYEIGEKVSFADDKVRVNSAIFYYDYKDYQVTTFKILGIVQANADATIKGAEVEVVAMPVDGLELSAGLSLLDTNIKDIARGAGLPLVDREMGEAPKVKGDALIRYEWPAFNGTLSAQLSGTYVGARWTDAQNLTVGRLPSYTILDGQLGYESGNGKFSVLLWGRNLTDERVPFNTLVTLTGFNIGQQKWNEKPVGGVTVRYSF
jgi:iron complex outermembrane receptor protein